MPSDIKALNFAMSGIFPNGLSSCLTYFDFNPSDFLCNWVYSNSFIPRQNNPYSFGTIYNYSGFYSNISGFASLKNTKIDINVPKSSDYSFVLVFEHDSVNSGSIIFSTVGEGSSGFCVGVNACNRPFIKWHEQENGWRTRTLNYKFNKRNILCFSINRAFNFFNFACFDPYSMEVIGDSFIFSNLSESFSSSIGSDVEKYDLDLPPSKFNSDLGFDGLVSDFILLEKSLHLNEMSLISNGLVSDFKEPFYSDVLKRSLTGFNSYYTQQPYFTGITGYVDVLTHFVDCIEPSGSILPFYEKSGVTGVLFRDVFVREPLFSDVYVQVLNPESIAPNYDQLELFGPNSILPFDFLDSGDYIEIYSLNGVNFESFSVNNRPVFDRVNLFPVNLDKKERISDWSMFCFNGLLQSDSGFSIFNSGFAEIIKPNLGYFYSGRDYHVFYQADDDDIFLDSFYTGLASGRSIITGDFLYSGAEDFCFYNGQKINNFYNFSENPLSGSDCDVFESINSSGNISLVSSGFFSSDSFYLESRPRFKSRSSLVYLNGVSLANGLDYLEDSYYDVFEPIKGDFESFVLSKRSEIFNLIFDVNIEL